MLDVILPGTGGMLPSDTRWLSCCWLESQGKAVLIDCGEGTQIALKKQNIRLGNIEVLLITHFHADHISGLPGLLLSIGNYGKTTPLIIAGPKGLARVTNALLTIAPNLPFPIEFTEFTENNSLEPQSFPSLRIDSFRLRHGMNCLGYKITLFRKPVFNPEKAAALNIPVQLYKVLHAGENITLESGELITPSMVLDGERTPVTVGYYTDTRAFAEIAEFVKDCDLLIAEGMHGDETLRDKIHAKKHSMFRESAKIAALAKVKRLWLTHYSPALANPREYLPAARAIFPKTRTAHDGFKITLPE
ncbi:MAG: ribonuclease Z [Oscillospiraceae bacterium]|nr:ribonuclease Z [Oscillospiraceae bacterium]